MSKPFFTEEYFRKTLEGRETSPMIFKFIANLANDKLECSPQEIREMFRLPTLQQKCVSYPHMNGSFHNLLMDQGIGSISWYLEQGWRVVSIALCAASQIALVVYERGETK